MFRIGDEPNEQGAGSRDNSDGILNAVEYLFMGT